MTNTLTREQFVKFAEDLFARKTEHNSISEDASGYFVKIDNDMNIPGRYSLHVVGPTGKGAFRYSVADIGMTLAALDLYDLATPDNKPDTDAHATSPLHLDRRNIDAEQLAHYFGPEVDQQRDHTEEEWQRAETEQEGLAELDADPEI